MHVVLLYFWLSVLYALGFTVQLVAFPFILNEILQKTVSPLSHASAFGIAMAAYPTLKALGAPVWGFLSDRAGRRRMLIYTLIGTILCTTLTPFCQSVCSLVLCRAILGLFAANGALLQCYATDIAQTTSKPQTEVSSLVSLYGSAWGLAYVVQAGFAVLAENVLRPHMSAQSLQSLPFFVASVCFQLSLFLLLCMPACSAAATSSTPLSPTEFFAAFRGSFAHPLLIGLLVASLATPSTDVFQLVLATHAQSVTVVYSVSFMIGAWCSLLLPFTPWLVRLRSCCTHRTIAASMSVMAGVVLGVMPFAASVALSSFYVVILLKAVAFATLEPSQTVVLNSLAPVGALGAFTGWQHFVRGLS
ncbi:MAG TPA: MFS transporter, partial [Oculatellaceae cyanobacterium]